MTDEEDGRDSGGARMKRLVEIRTYRVKPGQAAAFAQRMGEALLLVRASGMEVLRFGRSNHEHESFHLIRAFDDRAQLQAQQAAFYGSTAWRDGPREALLACLDDYLNTLLWLSPAAIDELRE